MLLRHEANIMIMSGSAAQTASDRNSDPCAERPSAGVLHRVSRPVIRMASRTRGLITRDSVGTDVPAVARSLVAGSVNVGRRNRDAPRWTGPVSGEMSPGRRKDDECSPPSTSACTGSRRRGIG
jgi:hypothetical protein